MDNSLKKLNKKELINIISKMKKNDLINIINNKIGGTNEIIKETKDAVRKPIIYDSKKIKKIIIMQWRMIHYIIKYMKLKIINYIFNIDII